MDVLPLSMCLVALVKDEEEHVERMLRSVLPYVDRWAIIDTGSEDATPQIIEDTIGHLPGRLLYEPFEGFGPGRTKLLELGRESGAEWTLMMDADLELRQDGPLSRLAHDEYMLKVEDRGLEYDLPLLTRSAKPFRYEGVVHSYLAIDEPFTWSKLRALVIVDHGAGGRRPGKIQQDLVLLQKDVAEHPDNPRSWYYLGQTFKDLDMIPEAIEAYRHRAAMSQGWDEERYNALYQAGMLLCEHVSYHEGAPLLLQAFRELPQRAEAVRALAHISHAVADKIPFPHDDRLFVEKGAYAQPEQPTEPVIASLATMPGREDSVLRTIGSLLPQVDELRVCLNEYLTMPEWMPDDPKLLVVFGKDHGDDGKLLWLPDLTPGYRFTCDDDLEYPPDYVSQMVAQIERYDRRAIIGLHGRLLDPEGELLAVFPVLEDVKVDRTVNLLGTGVMAYHTSVLAARLNGEVPEFNMADPFMAGLAQEHGIPMVVVAHGGGWLKHTDHERNMWDESAKGTGSPLDVGAKREAFYRSREWLVFSCE